MALGDAGLFDTKNLSRARAAMAMEDEARGQLAYKQAMPEGINAARVARATQNLRNLGRNVTTGLFGSDDPDGILTNDPRLTEGQSKDVFMAKMVKKYEKAAKDGSITTQEYQNLIGDFLQGGYTDEAKQLADIMKTQSESIDNLNPTSSKPYGSGGSTTWSHKMIKDPDTGEDRQAIYSHQPLYNKNTGAYDVKNKFLGWSDEQELLGGAKRSIGGQIITQVEPDRQIAWNKSKAIILNNRTTARDVSVNLRKVVNLLETTKVKTGGIYEFGEDVVNFFGFKSKNVNFAEIKSRLTDTILAKLKETGTRPTDADLAFIKSRMAETNKGNKQNVAILKSVLDRTKKMIERGDLLQKGKYTNVGDYENAVAGLTLDNIIKNIDSAAKTFLINNPGLASEFDKKYGIGTANRILGVN